MQAVGTLTAYVNGAANWFTFWGFWVTVVGFIVTIWQIVKTRSTAEAVQSAVGEVKQAVSREYLSYQLRDVVDDLSEIKAMHSARVPNLSLRRHDAARAKLIRLASDSELTDKEKVDLQATIVQLTSIQDRVQSSVFEDTQITEPARLLQSLSAQIDRLNRVEASMRNRSK